MRVAVTGASGFVGRALVRHLAERGHEVIALSRQSWDAPAGVRQQRVASYEGDAGPARLLEGAHALVHLAALAHRRGSEAEFAVNQSVTRALVAASRQAGVARFVLVSSIGVNGNATHGRSFSEGDAPAPAEPYAASKLRCEQAVAAGFAGAPGASYTILRPPLVYGPNAPGNFGKLVRAVRRGWPLPLKAVQNRRSLIGLDNLLGLIELCLAHPAAANQLFLAADGEDVSTPQMVEYIARGAGRTARLWPVPVALIRSAARVIGRGRTAASLLDDLQVDASKARNLLGWVPQVGVAHGMALASRETVAS